MNRINCKKAKSLYYDMPDGEIPGEVSAHLASCAECAADYSRARRAAEIIRDAAPQLDEALSSRITEAVMTAVRGELPERRSKDPGRSIIVINRAVRRFSAVSAAVLLLAFGIFLFRDRGIDIAGADMTSLTSGSADAESDAGIPHCLIPTERLIHYNGQSDDDKSAKKSEALLGASPDYLSENASDASGADDYAYDYSEAAPECCMLAGNYGSEQSNEEIFVLPKKEYGVLFTGFVPPVGW